MIRITISMILFAAVGLPAGGAFAQAYPAKPIRVIVPAAPGDSCDVLSRLIGQKVGERLGQPLAVDNRVGAGGRRTGGAGPEWRARSSRPIRRRP